MLFRLATRVRANRDNALQLTVELRGGSALDEDVVRIRIQPALHLFHLSLSDRSFRFQNAERLQREELLSTHRDHVGAAGEDGSAIHTEEHPEMVRPLRAFGCRDVARIGVVPRDKGDESKADAP